MLIRVECRTCGRGGYICEGYSTRLHWNTAVTEYSGPTSTPDYTIASNGDLPRMAGTLSPGGIWDKRWPGYRMVHFKIPLT
jgi:hypothetical protein